ncbi:2-methylcitrate dehydratase [Viridibacillus arvi]|uniref:2-methylcitrate dehydratase n=1 Tax=Viridibacillus arvi TaxID=263475 RepID=UPI0034CFFE5A
MSYANFKATVKKLNIKPKGVQEIVLEINGAELDGQLEAIAQMVDLRVAIELDSEIVSFRRKVNVITNQPTVRYSVSDKGIVEVQAPEQLELDGMPEEEIQFEEEECVIDRKVVDAFVLSGIAPTYDDYHKDIVDIIKRRVEGESYRKLAEEIGLSTSELVNQTKRYRARVAPLASAWWEWKQTQVVGEGEE